MSMVEGNAVMRVVVSVNPECDAESADSLKLACNLPRWMSVLVMTCFRLSSVMVSQQ